MRLWGIERRAANELRLSKQKRETRAPRSEKSSMQKALNLVRRLGRDESGAALVEYTVLLGVMLVAVIGTIVLVGGWVNTKWTALWTALSGS